MSSCTDDDMFPSHEPLPFDPASLKADAIHSSDFTSSLSSHHIPFSSPLPGCDSSSQLEAQQRAITSLQQDVFALRHLLESEMNKMREEMKQNLIALESRMIRSCQPLDATKTTSYASPSKAVSCASPCEVAVSPPPSSSSAASRPSPRHQGVWSNGFLDSDCGDDFTPHHPSQMDGKTQQCLLAHLMDEQKKPALPTCDAFLPLKAQLDSLPSKAADSRAVSHRSPSAEEASKSTSAQSSTALSISSLTALINPAGLPLTEPQLIQLACRILADHGSVPVGKMGSLLHKAANDHTLPALLKERYGGLKKFLQAQSRYFILGEDHPYNPHVALVGQQQLPSNTQTTAHTAPSPATGSLASSGPFAGASKDAAKVSAGDVEDAYALALVNSLVDDGDSYFSYPSTTRPAIASTPHSLFPTSGSSNSSHLASYSSRLQEALSASGGSDVRTARESHLTAVVSLDCEMVGCGVDGSRSVLARCSVVNYDGFVLYDAFVQPSEVVSDYRTRVSGIRPGDLEPPKAIPFHQAQREVKGLIHERIVVAHSVVGDLQALGISHPIHLLRDTAHFPLLCPDRPRSLRSLVHERLGWLHFQSGEHDSVEDARAVMSLYRAVEDAWERCVEDEQAMEEREKQRSAANTRHRSLLVEQQREHMGYAMNSHAFAPSGHRMGGGSHEGEVHGRGGHHFGQTGLGGQLNLLTSSHSSIHSALWK